MPKVLVVEDDTLVREIMIDALQEEGLEVIQASDAAEAQSELEEGHDISVVLTDIEMPGGRGSELATHVSKCWPHIRVVMTSGRTWPNPTEMPKNAVFLPKPWTGELLAQYVWEALERARITQRAAP